METLNRLKWGVATLTAPGQAESGDRDVVKHLPDGVLVAAVDGLGHGEEAAEAATLAVRVLEAYAQESVLSLVRRCHESLRMTRGVVMSLASFNALDGTMTWLGVGNVEGRLFRADPRASPRYESLLLRGGVVGGQLPMLSASLVPLMPGDTLIFTTDGVRNDFSEALAPAESPQHTADHILAHYSRRTDDALVVVARWVGRAP